MVWVLAIGILGHHLTFRNWQVLHDSVCRNCCWSTCLWGGRRWRKWWELIQEFVYSTEPTTFCCTGSHYFAVILYMPYLFLNKPVWFISVSPLLIRWQTELVGQSCSLITSWSGTRKLIELQSKHWKTGIVSAL